MFLNYKKPINIQPLILDEYYNDGKVKTIRYRILSPNDSYFQFNYPQSPPPISFANIEKLDDPKRLKELEKIYDDFLERNCQILLLLDIVEEYLDIRDALSIKIARLEREDRVKRYREKLYQEEDLYKEYNNTYQNILPQELKLTDEEINKGYIPYPNEPKEFKCGCLSIKYYAQCTCKKTTSVCTNVNCNEKNFQKIKLFSYCLTHNWLKRKEEKLERELKNIKKKLEGITAQSNSLDLDDYINLKEGKNKRISKFPWKNINLKK